MKMKRTLIMAGLLGCISVVITMPGCTKEKKEQHPNFIILIDDQHNAKYMGWTGKGEGIRTPHLDKLASESIAFSNAYANCPVCAPSRHSMYTGHFPSRHGVILNDMKLREGLPTLMELLADAGYTTANIGKMHFGPYNARHGFQYVLNHEFFDNAAGISHFRPCGITIFVASTFPATWGMASQSFIDRKGSLSTEKYCGSGSGCSGRTSRCEWIRSTKC